MSAAEYFGKGHMEGSSGMPGEVHMEEASLRVLGETEERHFWAQTKVRIVQQYLCKFLDSDRKSQFSLLDIGCGNGVLMQFLSQRWPGIHCTGIDGHPTALKLARNRMPNARLVLKNILHIDEWDQEKKFDVITVLDVIEHLDDPIQLLRSLRKRTTSNGILIVSVPAFPCLWSERDIFLGHRKRYSKKMLVAELRSAGWDVRHCNYCFSFMLVPVYLLRKVFFPFVKYNGENMETAELKVIPLLNGILRVLGALETKILTKFPIPFGASVFCIARPHY